MPETLKAVLFALAVTPVLYGLVAAVLDASGYQGTYGDGRLVLAACFFVAFSGARFVIRRFKGSAAGNSLKES
jgi:hypothetical protein